MAANMTRKRKRYLRLARYRRRTLLHASAGRGTAERHLWAYLKDAYDRPPWSPIGWARPGTTPTERDQQ